MYVILVQLCFTFFSHFNVYAAAFILVATGGFLVLH